MTFSRVDAPNIGLQRTSACGIAAEAGSFGGVIRRAMCVGMLLATGAAAPRSFAQVPTWAENREFDLNDVEMALTRPHAGFGRMSPDGRIDDPGFVYGYTVTVYGTGRVVRVDEPGDGTPQVVEQDLSRELIYGLLDRFVRVRFFDLPAEYHGGTTIGPWMPGLFKSPLIPPAHFHFRRARSYTDGSYLKLKLKIADHEKTVTAWEGEGPKDLEEIATAMEKVGKVRQVSK